MTIVSKGASENRVQYANEELSLGILSAAKAFPDASNKIQKFIKNFFIFFSRQGLTFRHMLTPLMRFSAFSTKKGVLGWFSVELIAGFLRYSEAC